MRIFFFLLFLCGGICSAQVLQPGKGVFWYSGYKPLAAKPIRVFYYYPAGNPVRMPILLAFHGDDRDAAGALQDWQSAADANHFLVLAPQFSDSLFPGNAYFSANIFDDGDYPTPSTLHPDSLWTFNIIESLYQFSKAQLGSVCTGYVGFGHSAGSQYLHRMHEYNTQGSMAESFCANAGWYTMPDTTIAFPYGQRLTPTKRASRARAFAKPLHVWLGQQDISTTSYNLRHTPGADAQGLNRFTRGNYFYTQSGQLARNQGMPYGWTVNIAYGIGHDHTGMAKACATNVNNALAATIPALPTLPPVPPMRFYVTGEHLYILDLPDSIEFSLSLYSLLGQMVFSVSGGNPSSPVVLSSLPTGLYLAKIQANGRPEQLFKVFVSR